MKTINIPIEDDDYEALIKAKGSMSWREYLLKDIIKGGQKNDTQLERTRMDK